MWWFALGFLGGFLVVHYWNDILEWFSNILPKIANVVRTLAYGVQYATDVVASLLDKASAAIKHHLYYKEGDHWVEKTTTRQLPESELPPHIRQRIKVRGQEQDITREIESETGLTV